MAQKIDLSGNDLVIGDIFAGASTAGSAGTDLSTTSLTALAGVTAGTATASKAVILDSGTKLSGINNITYGAGTATVAPVNLTAGTNLTTAAAGALEFDGTAFYATAVASSRQQLDAEQYTIANADSATYNNTGLDTATASPVFTSTMGGSAAGAITLVAGKTYAYEACYVMTNTGTTSHTWAALFGGNATITASMMQAFGISTTAANTPATGGLTGFATGTDLTFGGTGVVVTAASTSATEQVTILLNGTITVNAGGTLIPQLKASARPGASGTPGVVVKRGSFFRIWEMSTSATVGNWS